MPRAMTLKSVRSGQPTMKDVASASGVGVGTVSRVFAGSGGVSKATRARVEDAARELGFRPSALGRNLKNRKRTDIGLVVADIANSFYAEFAKGVLNAASARGHHVILFASGEDEQSEREYIDFLVEQRVHGIIAFPTGKNRKNWMSARSLDINVVFADRTIDGLDVPSVVVDNLAGMRRLTAYLLALGHRRIGYLGGPRDLTSGRRREEGYRLAHVEAGVEVHNDLVVRTRFTRDTARTSALSLIDPRKQVTAIIAANNILGEAVLGAVRERGIRVRHGISVAMFDDVPWATLVEPPMTVVAQPPATLGEIATRLVLAPTSEDSHVTVQTELMIRGSTGPLQHH